MRTFQLAIAASLVIGCAPPAPPRCPEPSRIPEPASPTARAAPEPEPLADAPAVAILRGLLGPDPRPTYDAFAESFRDAIPLAKIAEGLQSSREALGEIVELRLAEESPNDGHPRSTVLAFRERGVEVFTVTRDEKGVLVGLRLKDLVDRDEAGGPGPADDYVAKRTYKLPGKGKWFVANGGSSSKQNHHVGNKQQWYAFDIDVRDEAGKDARGAGTKNEDHYAFGEPVLAPADGKVVFVVDAVEDYPPGEREGYFVPGNTVIIDHGDDEFSLLAHFKKGSVVVKPGQKVKTGQKLGLVGNSGNTSNPHVHWHLATKGGLSRGHGLPIRFAPLLVNGKRVEDARPVRGDTIENAP